MILLEELFHQLGRWISPTENGKTLARLRRRTIGSYRAVVIDPQKEIFLRARTDFGKEQPGQIWRSVNLLEGTLHYRAERVMHQPPQRHVGCRSRETLRARKFNCRHSQSLDIARMTNRAHRDPIVDLKNLLSRPASNR